MFSPSVGKGFTPERIECVPTASLKDKLRANIEQDGQDIRMNGFDWKHTSIVN